MKRKVATMPKKINLGPHAVKPVKATYNGAKVNIVARNEKLGTVVIDHDGRIKSVRASTVQENAKS